VVAAGPGGFTLVELLVSVALILLLMVMFAQIFQVATETMSKQRGLGLNDQRSRTLVTVLRGDLNNRTFRDVVPFASGQNTTTFANLSRRSGYFSISENDPDSNIDDVLQFTIMSDKDPDTDVKDKSPYSGKAVVLKPAASMDTNETYLASNPNQPEFDDGVVQSNGMGGLTGLVNSTGSSKAAEVAYFVRNGNLYRRVLLVREPYSDPTATAQPAEISGNYGSTLTPNGSGHFWRDFDYSAWRKNSGANPGVYFHHWETSLSNRSDSIVDSDIGFPISLGIPHVRFGHSISRADGTPREFVGTMNDKYIGRFTMQETADSDFGYPGTNPTGGDPHTRADLDLDATTNMVTPFANETNRRGEDILMTNVHEFDIKVWDDDPGVLDWRDVGNSSGTGRYCSARCLNTAHLRRYDTWHPYQDVSWTATAPYRPVSNGADGQPGVAGIDDDGVNGTDDAGEQGWLGSDDEIPLRGIRISIRYLDPASGQMRSLTIVHSLID